MTPWLVAVALAVLLEAPQPELDCARPTSARNLIGRLRLSEIEWAEDVNRAAMWDAFGRCAAAPGADACRQEQRQRFSAELERQTADIDAKYGRMLREFEARCRASIT
jgi:hypothetical protein